MSDTDTGRPRPHDASHYTYDAESGLCDDCGAMVDPVAAPIAAALGPATRAFRLAQDRVADDDEMDEMDVLDVCLTAALRAALAARTPQPAECPDNCDGPECDHPPRVGGACLPCAAEHAKSHDAPLPAVPDGSVTLDDLSRLDPSLALVTDREAALARMVDAAARWPEGSDAYVVPVPLGWLRALSVPAMSDEVDAPARLDAAADAIALINDLLRELLPASNTTPTYLARYGRWRARATAVAAALARPTGGEQ